MKRNYKSGGHEPDQKPEVQTQTGDITNQYTSGI